MWFWNRVVIWVGRVLASFDVGWQEMVRLCRTWIIFQCSNVSCWDSKNREIDVWRRKHVRLWWLHFTSLILSSDLKVAEAKSPSSEGAVIVQWIRLSLPSCCIRFESHGHHLHFYKVELYTIFVIVLRKGRK